MKAIDDANVTQILTSRHKLNEKTITPIRHGAWASAYSYHYQGHKYVIRLSDIRENFDRDSLAHNYNSPSLPVPQILEIGEYSQGYYAISKFVHGEFFDNLTTRNLVIFSSCLVNMFRYLRQIDLGAVQGFGHWDASGNGRSKSWQEFLLSVKEDNSGSLIHGWKNNLKESPLGMDSYNHLYQQLEAYIDYCPEERSLIHSDLLNFNFIVRDNLPAAVLDWGSSIYGDSLYEIAWFVFYEIWYPPFAKAGLINLLVEDYKNTARNADNISERLLAYQLHIGIDSIAYNAFREDWSHAKQAIQTTEQILESSKSVKL